MTAYGWEGKRRSGVALALRDRIGGLSADELKASGRKMNSAFTLIQDHVTPAILSRDFVAQ